MVYFKHFCVINTGDALLQSGEVYVVSPLQLYALTERLKLPEPTCGKFIVTRMGFASVPCTP